MLSRGFLSVAERVKQLRKELGNISQAELALRIGVTSNAVAAWEQGIRKPQEMNCLRLAALSRSENSRFFALRAGVDPGKVDDYARRGRTGRAPLAAAPASLRRKRRREAQDLGPPDASRIEAVVKKNVEAGLASLEKRTAEGFARIEKLLSSFLHEPAGSGVRVKKAIRIRGQPHEKERAQKPQPYRAGRR